MNYQNPDSMFYEDENTRMNNMYMNESQKNNNVVAKDKKKSTPLWLTLLLLSITLVIILCIFYLNFYRYRLVAKSINQGNDTIGALLLSPEIFTGLSSLMA